VYFEANGHGTALFSPRLLRDLQHLLPPASAEPLPEPEPEQGAAMAGERGTPPPPAAQEATPSEVLAARRLLALAAAVNQSVGDALSGILLVEAALRLVVGGCNYALPQAPSP
jgi:hypothetical protein